MLSRRRLPRALAAVALLASGFAATSALGEPPPSSAGFTLTDEEFVPEGGSGSEVTVAAGGTVTFSFPSGLDEHNVEFVDDGVSCEQTAGAVTGPSGVVMPAEPEGEGWAGECTFTELGRYEFFCQPHAGTMKGAVVVATETATPTPTATVTATPTATATATPTATPVATATPVTSGGPPAAPPATAATTAPAPRLTLSKRQRGATVRGSLSRGVARSKVTIEVRARRGALGKRSPAGRVGRRVARTSAAGALRFSVKLAPRARAALARRGKLALSVRVSYALPVGGTRTTTTAVTLRRGAQ